MSLPELTGECPRCGSSRIVIDRSPGVVSRLLNGFLPPLLRCRNCTKRFRPWLNLVGVDED